VHLAIAADHTTINVESDRRIVVQPLRATFKDGTGHDHLVLGSRRRQTLAGRPRNLFGEFEASVIFALARIRRIEDFLQTDDLAACLGGLPDPFDRFVDVGLLVLSAAHLHQGQVYYA
jgi:hypothetical protein